MDFSWNQEQEQAYAEARRFAEADLGPPAGDDDAGYAGFRRRWSRLAGFGLLGISTPAEHGGQGLDPLTAMRVLEGIGYGTSDNGLLMALGAQLWSVVPPLVAFGSAAQQATWLPELAAGRVIGAFALSESEAGSDVFHLRTRAVGCEGGFRLSGSKAFVTNAPVADVFVVLAATGPSGYFGLTAFLLPRGLAGVRIGPPLRKMGLESSPMAELLLDDVGVGPEAVLGEVGGGAAVLQLTLEWERGCLLAPSLGTMARLLDQTAAHCRARKQFGRPIIEFEAVAAQLADCRLRLELSRLLSYRFAWLKQSGLGAATEASMVKLYLSESLRLTAQRALHLHGAAGYTREYEFERTWRDAMASSLYSGTTEMQHNLIAESLLRAPAPAPARALEAAP